MSIRKKLIKLKNDNMWLRLLWFYSLVVRAKKSKWLSDEDLIKRNFKLAFGQEPDLENPKTFYEKLNWMKLNYRNKLLPIVCDKYLVHEYIRSRGYGHLLNNVIGVWDNVDSFDENKLPERFVLKATHASGNGWSLIVKNKKEIAWYPFKMVMRQWLKQGIEWMGREWHYGEMTPRIICEKYLEDESGELRDYKFHCFAGEPKFVNVCIGRFSNHKQFLCFNRNWELLPFTKDALAVGADFTLEKPENLEEMFNLAKDISKEFPYVRVDFYNVNGRIYFGELTFFDFSGFSSPYTPEAQKTIGNWLTLPKANK